MNAYAVRVDPSTGGHFPNRQQRGITSRRFVGRHTRARKPGDAQHHHRWGIGLGAFGLDPMAR